LVSGFMQREIRLGPVNRPSNIKDLYVPIQRCYKNVKWFGETPCQGKRFVKAHRGRLRKQFKVQLQQIWDVSRMREESGASHKTTLSFTLCYCLLVLLYLGMVLKQKCMNSNMAILPYLTVKFM
jgi:hypothetical protein